MQVELALPQALIPAVKKGLTNKHTSPGQRITRRH